jgi:hypothetical protein
MRYKHARIPDSTLWLTLWRFYQRHFKGAAGPARKDCRERHFVFTGDLESKIVFGAFNA